MRTTNHISAIVAIAGRVCILIASVFALLLSRMEAATGASSSGNPTITASPQVVPMSGSRRDGYTTLIWESGAGHPNAEVWVQVDGQDETLLVKQGKGGRRMPVEPGKSYLYILKDAGERLATVAVNAAPSDPAAPSGGKSFTGPTIRASPQLVSVPRTGATGSTSLIWDAGADHRNAEVRVQVDGQETLVAQGGKGGRRMKVEGGKSYLYILTDAGQRLATVTVQAAPPSDSAPPSQSQAQSSGSPTIFANPQIVLTPRTGAAGTTNLVWHGGADHPNAEVWVQVDGQEEKLVAKQGKGSRQLMVEPGRNHLYILKDSGQRLATVSVRSQSMSLFPK